MKKILVIDDDEYIRRYYFNLLTLNKYSVETSDNATDALIKAKDFKPDLILLDIIMPMMGGIKILENLKNDSDTAILPIIVLTNLSDPEILEEAMNKGAASYIVKANASPENVLDEVNKYIGS